ncbi:LnmK family bifunctional acyltransferase/decarboxylase [Streptomyces sp. NPDC052109]|uniref:LnmK family bifunctional acyltransferase/decarboxylase n=1 Tax=Streptomyces sp. NPDC052109 TaxID=3155527 RepID=UPI003412419D
MSTLRRTVRVRPGMCGHNSLFAGQIGDWTWDAVAEVCGTDVLRARDASGAPTYLSFYYYRVRGSRRFHLRSPAFGDELHVTTRLFGFGSESVLTLHRISGDPRAAAAPLEPEDFYAFGDPDSLYVENFNRWVARGTQGTNASLVRSSPPDFTHEHLPTLPEKFSPRHAYGRARTELTFLDHGTGRPGAELVVDYDVDPSRDLNGAGLLYFASYFSIVDWALLRLWRRLGRDDRSFLDRVAVDQQLCYLGNADAGRPLTVTLRHWPGPDGEEAVDVVLRDRDGGRVLAVCSLRFDTGVSG